MTSSQVLARLFRHVNGRPQVTHGLDGRSCFLIPRIGENPSRCIRCCLCVRHIAACWRLYGRSVKPAPLSTPIIPTVPVAGTCYTSVSGDSHRSMQDGMCPAVQFDDVEEIVFSVTHNEISPFTYCTTRVALLIVQWSSSNEKITMRISPQLSYAFCDETASPRILAAAYCTERTMLW